jgi:uncharacterized protein (TIGR00297 family)
MQEALLASFAMTSQLFLGLLLGALAGGAAYRASALTPGGAVAAALVGATIFAAGGWRWAFVLLIFFVSSSVLSRLPGEPWNQTDKQGPRDAAQVLANGGLPAVAAIAELLHPDGMLWPVVLASGVAAATADTWASEVGSRFGGTPRAILSGRSLPAGASGAVTVIGSLASLLGALSIALASVVLLHLSGRAMIATGSAGVAGSLLDTLLGATIQERRQCPHCGATTEQRIHQSCSSTTFHSGGIQGLDNDWVNGLACVCAACTGIAVARLLGTL